LVFLIRRSIHGEVFVAKAVKRNSKLAIPQKNSVSHHAKPNIGIKRKSRNPMKVKCRVTFEFDIRQPRTWNGEVEGSSTSTLARRAVDAAYKEMRPRNWISFTLVVLERFGEIEDPINKEEDVPLPLD
jgi:hypothetical protein